jgi:excisionase family DNA binding protein
VPRLAFSIDEAAAALGMSPATLWRWIGEGWLRSVKRGGRRLIPISELERLLTAE